MRLLWYGCSWVEGVQDITPFPNLVSRNLGLEYENRGVISSSIDCMVAKFSEDYNTGKITKSDVVVFCATSSYRIVWSGPYDEYFKFNYYDLISHTGFESSEKNKAWILNFADDNVSSFLAFKNLSLLYFICKSMNIKCFFVNSYYPLTPQTSNLIPPENWLLPFDQSCVNLFEFKIVKPEPVIDDALEFKHNVWINHKEKIEKYLIPNDNHPNQLGNETIANYLTPKLKKKL